MRVDHFSFALFVGFVTRRSSFALLPSSKNVVVASLREQDGPRGWVAWLSRCRVRADDVLLVTACGESSKRVQKPVGPQETYKNRIYTHYVSITVAIYTLYMFTFSDGDTVPRHGFVQRCPGICLAAWIVMAFIFLVCQRNGRSILVFVAEATQAHRR